MIHQRSLDQEMTKTCLIPPFWSLRHPMVSYVSNFSFVTSWKSSCRFAMYRGSSTTLHWSWWQFYVATYSCWVASDQENDRTLWMIFVLCEFIGKSLLGALNCQFLACFLVWLEMWWNMTFHRSVPFMYVVPVFWSWFCLWNCVLQHMQFEGAYA